MRNLAPIRAALAAAMLCLAAGSAVAGERVVIFAAASLKGALDAALADYGDAEVTVSYGGSAAQARQVALGAPADIVILAHPEWMDWLAGQGALAGTPPRDLLRNRLVLIAPEDGPERVAPADIVVALGDGRLAMGQRDAVPAGHYARQWLEAEGLWPALEGRLAETENVRAALALVSLGEAPLGVVYATDARAEPGVRVVLEVPPEAHDPIRYPAALTADATPEAARLLDWLAGPEAQAVFAEAGFLAPAPADAEPAQ